MTRPRPSSTTYGHDVGTLMLDTSFPRPVGDIGNARTWPFPMLYRVVTGARPRDVLTMDAQSAIKPFVEAAHELVDAGVRAITTSCGYLAVTQQELAAALDVPVLTSALLQVPEAARQVGPERSVGVLTVSDLLGDDHFAGAGFSRDDTRVTVHWLAPDTTFVRTYAPLSDQQADRGPVPPTAAELEAEVVAAALELVRIDPAVGVIVMECTNLVPYGDAVRRATGLPVLDHYTLVMRAWQSLPDDDGLGGLTPPDDRAR